MPTMRAEDCARGGPMHETLESPRGQIQLLENFRRQLVSEIPLVGLTEVELGPGKRVDLDGRPIDHGYGCLRIHTTHDAFDPPEDENGHNDAEDNLDPERLRVLSNDMEHGKRIRMQGEGSNHSPDSLVGPRGI